MQKRKKLAVIGTLLIVLVAGGIVWQVVDVNRTGRSPVSTPVSYTHLTLPTKA